METKNHFYVIWENNGDFEPYDVIPYLTHSYIKRVRWKKEAELANDTYEDRYRKVPETYDEFREFVKQESMYQWWSRCEYEIILRDWPGQRKEEKWDIHKQLMMNIDIVVELIMDETKNIIDGRENDDRK